MKILIVNGPNLNLLGQREPGVYGSKSFEEYLEELRTEYPDVEIQYYQSNHEGDLVDVIHVAGGYTLDMPKYQKQPELEVGFTDDDEDMIVAVPEVTAVDGVVLNAGAYTHTSVALHDAIRAVKIPVIEVHISNVHQREEFRHHSYISPAASGIIVGFGIEGYGLAVQGLINKITK